VQLAEDLADGEPLRAANQVGDLRRAAAGDDLGIDREDDRAAAVAAARREQPVAREEPVCPNTVPPSVR
jgi:hypothetical protein